jgi:hypothetical protein
MIVEEHGQLLFPLFYDSYRDLDATDFRVWFYTLGWVGLPAGWTSHILPWLG